MYFKSNFGFLQVPKLDAVMGKLKDFNANVPSNLKLADDQLESVATLGELSKDFCRSPFLRRKTRLSIASVSARVVNPNF